MAKKVEKGQLALDRPLDEWLNAALAVEGLQQAEITRAVLVDSCRLPQPFHADAVDLVVALAAASPIGAQPQQVGKRLPPASVSDHRAKIRAFRLFRFRHRNDRVSLFCPRTSPLGLRALSNNSGS